MKALVVSGTPEARAWMRGALGPDWACDEAEDGLVALRIVRGDDVDLVIADESSEPLGAFGLAKELRTLPYPPAIVVILDRPQDAWLAAWSGADAWLLQPIDPFSLGRVAEEVIAGQDARAGEEPEPAAQE